MCSIVLELWSCRHPEGRGRGGYAKCRQQEGGCARDFCRCRLWMAPNRVVTAEKYYERSRQVNLQSRLNVSSDYCLWHSLVRRHGSLTKELSSILTGRQCPPAESTLKSADVDTQSETDAVNVRHEDYGTTGTTSLQVCWRVLIRSENTFQQTLYTLYIVTCHFLGFIGLASCYFDWLFSFVLILGIPFVWLQLFPLLYSWPSSYYYFSLTAVFF